MNIVIPGFWYIEKQDIKRKFYSRKYKLLSTQIYNFKNNFKKWSQVEKLYKTILVELSNNLNQIHQLNWKTSSWEIIVGPWLKKYLTITLDRISIAKNNYKKKNNFYFVNSKSNFHLNSYDINDFIGQVINDKWNEEIFKRLYKYFKTNKKNFLKKNKININNSFKNDILFKIKILIFNFFLKFYNNIFCKKSKFIFSRPYLGKKNSFMKLLLKLGEFPILYFLDEKKMSLEFNAGLRQRLKFKKTSNEIEKISKILIYECLPRIYLEGFKTIQKKIENSSLPKERKVIFTSNIRNDSMFKFWLAGQKQIGSKIIIAQHGGGYNMFKFDESLSYELKISDKYLSWGWKNKKYKKKVIPLSILNQNIKPNLNFNPKNKISLIMNNFDQYVYANDPPTVLNLFKSEKNNNYKELEVLIKFLTNLNDKVKNKFILRPHPSKLRKHTTQKFEEKFEEKFKFNRDYSITAEKFLKNFQLNIFTQAHSTAFAFSMAMNLPTISIYPHNMNYFTSEAKKIINLLKKAKICHTNHKSAAKFVNENYKDSLSWWNLKKTKFARKKFCDLYGKCSNNEDLSKLINILVKEKQKIGESKNDKR